ncbi:MAG: nicotinate-nucleotide adenylyltransferase [Bacteroidetes bacterium]|jgi:nicotinate-nucleotide adenylyltransferase|nr:nicotinate-nucleotide adenylyltransferase [Bacteroidota bacterium]MBT6684716.1 nicotinate-nucleotide adenylyltransferase [Bacteroidota bacterium]MBT7143158.1 nicotinate-nucleotide adenylyltransferase [Bacteroidota bacterium]MBT7492601.1 nicotinate-nucleotide adenylyltransferase [Bacteroidota bacterium]
MKVGLYFGSFNPIHIGHLAIANYMVEFSDIDQLWFVISPQNPFKKKSSLLADYHRLELVNLAIGDSNMLKSSNIEFKLSQPSYTIDTLVFLKEKYPVKNFVLIMGSDGISTFHKWKNYTEILKHHQIYVYPRPNCDNSKAAEYGMKIIDAPQIEISSSFIRNSIKNGKDVRYFMPTKVSEYITEMHFFSS